MVRLIPNCFPNSHNALEANWGPWSNITLSGSPKHLYMLLRRSSAVPLVVIVLLQEDKITPFVRPWSTMTIIASYPWDSGRLVMKSIKIWAKGLPVRDPLIGIRGGLVAKSFYEGGSIICNNFKQCPPSVDDVVKYKMCNGLSGFFSQHIPFWPMGQWIMALYNVLESGWQCHMHSVHVHFQK